MTLDNIVYIDSPIYREAHYREGGELLVCLYNGIEIIVFGVSEKTSLKLYRCPTHETLWAIINTHQYKKV